MKDRIKQFMDYKSISAGELANILEVQRSNISHILNGRNKPGAAFIEKLLVTYPDLNARWLLTGEGHMMNSEENIVNVPRINPRIENVKPGLSNQTVTKEKDNKHIEKIIILLSDGTFIDYEKKQGD